MAEGRGMRRRLKPYYVLLIVAPLFFTAFLSLLVFGNRQLPYLFVIAAYAVVLVSIVARWRRKNVA